MHGHHSLSFSACFGWNPLNVLKCPPEYRRVYSQLEQPLFLRMASGVVPKTNLTFCSTPWGQRTYITCRVVGDGDAGGKWVGEMVYARKSTQ